VISIITIIVKIERKMMKDARILDNESLSFIEILTINNIADSMLVTIQVVIDIKVSFITLFFIMSCSSDFVANNDANPRSKVKIIENTVIRILVKFSSKVKLKTHTRTIDINKGKRTKVVRS
jgi:hypothetical protein